MTCQITTVTVLVTENKLQIGAVLDLVTLICSRRDQVAERDMKRFVLEINEYSHII